MHTWYASVIEQQEQQEQQTVPPHGTMHIPGTKGIHPWHRWQHPEQQQRSRLRRDASAAVRARRKKAETDDFWVQIKAETGAFLLFWIDQVLFVPFLGHLLA
jgi:hypothetical protein